MKFARNNIKTAKTWKDNLVFLVTIFYEKLMYFLYSVIYDATATIIFIR